MPTVPPPAPGPAPAPVGELVRAPKTAEIIAGHLRARIVHGELAPGDTLPSEQQLMEQFGVSRPTLREAFRVLEAESLIVVRRGARGGAQVTRPDFSVAARYIGLILQMQGTTVADVYEARLVQEPYCARLLALHHTAQDLADLRAVADELATLVGDDGRAVPDARRWTDLTVAFHRLILDRCGNRTLAAQSAVLADIVERHLHTSLSRGFEAHPDARAAYPTTVRSFRRLLRYLEARDGDGAQQHWHAHMSNAATTLFGTDPADRPVLELFA